ncbi:MAG: acyltransferase [Bacilli bacterium]|nr:acyltransferase [Bacilli bacterium]
MNSKYYKRIDLIRVVSCFAVLLYHLSILKGGYLAVCTFFLLSGYLAVVSSFKKMHFSLKDYYISRFKKLYIPLLIVVFISVFIMLLLPNNNWMNLKPEVKSILFGYNNYWQLNANLDYFVRSISSPFIHLWYISILFQFELIFPVVYLFLRWLGKYIGKVLPCFILLIFAITSYILFIKVMNKNVMFAYYGTFARSFSLLLGMLLGFVHVYYRPIKFNSRIISNLLFWLYLIGLVIMFLFINDKSILFSSSMLITSLISMRLIDYAIFDDNSFNKLDRKVFSLSKLSYEVYLCQYPVIFLFQKINISSFFKVPLIIIIVFVVSYILYKTVNIKKGDKYNIVRFLILILSLIGFVRYLMADDYSKEMKKLEKKLNENRLLVEKKQKDYENKRKNDEDEWNNTLNDLNSSEESIRERVKNLNIVGVGDSIMLGTINQLYKTFPNGYFDGKVNRTTRQTNDVLLEIKNKNLLSDVVLFNIGTNGEFYKKYTDAIMETVGDRKVFWVNATHADYDTFNSQLESFAKEHSNVHIIDWVSVAKGHPEYLSKDQVHPTSLGGKVYAETIYNAICEEYLSEFNEQKAKKIKEHEEQEKNRITFIGDDLLLGIYDDLENKYSNDEFIVDESFNYNSLKKIINKKILDKSLAYNVVLVFNSKTKLNNNSYNEIVKLCNNHKIYIIDMNNSISLNSEFVTVINFYKEIKNNNNYVKFDGVHLTSEGNKALLRILNKALVN